MEKHPGGAALTRRLIDLSGLTPPARVLDMGAGEGDAVRYLRALGFEALGIDLCPGPDVTAGDFFACPFPDGGFDAVLSECAMFVSGDAPAAMAEAGRLLRPGGVLLLADVCFGPPPESGSGLRLRAREDATAAWREYYLRLVWEGADGDMCGVSPGGRCGYYLSVLEKEA